MAAEGEVSKRKLADVHPSGASSTDSYTGGSAIPTPTAAPDSVPRGAELSDDFVPPREYLRRPGRFQAQLAEVRPGRARDVSADAKWVDWAEKPGFQGKDAEYDVSWSSDKIRQRKFQQAHGGWVNWEDEALSPEILEEWQQWHLHREKNRHNEKNCENIEVDGGTASEEQRQPRQQGQPQGQPRQQGHPATTTTPTKKPIDYEVLV